MTTRSDVAARPLSPSRFPRFSNPSTTPTAAKNRAPAPANRADQVTESGKAVYAFQRRAGRELGVNTADTASASHSAMAENVLQGTGRRADCNALPHSGRFTAEARHPAAGSTHH